MLMYGTGKQKRGAGETVLGDTRMRGMRECHLLRSMERYPTCDAMKYTLVVGSAPWAAFIQCERLSPDSRLTVQ